MDLHEYQEFVNGKLSNESIQFDTMIESFAGLYTDGNKIGVKIPELLTAAVGLSAEAGEFTEIVKKMIFQGKPLNEENAFHMKRELGDAMFYMAVACSALGLSIADVIDENVTKLDARYKGQFTVDESENRKVGDL